eukprot:TRINITY_DN5405_c0_g1_i13.p1 TRINITY_DN5405_c0_g1~~TRINITY_DN5405_c0_g1_i13.p1  ORF type:complete len:176 (-),score=1.72 TRINITY_DN5405_c0_g1_i13:302-829(-)
MLTYDMEERISASEALQEPWLADFRMSKEIGEKDVLTALDGLKKFRTHTKLQTAVLSYITSQHLSKEQENRIREVFKIFDKDQNGELTKKELINILLMMYGDSRRVNREVEEIFRNFDLDDKGTITYNGMLVLHARISRCQPKARFCIERCDIAECFCILCYSKKIQLFRTITVK